MTDKNFRSTNINNLEFGSISTENKLLRASFSWMAMAMLLTSVASLLFAFEPSLKSLLYETTIEGFMQPTMLAYVVMFAPLIFVLFISFGINKMSYQTLIIMFIAYSIINGISFSFIFLIYEMGSIFKVFLSTTALFALMAIAGYTTKTDLTKLGSILMIGLIGIVIASIINFFMQSEKMDYLISVIGVVIFTGLTAYDVQKIKNLGQTIGDSADNKKLGVLGALTLYMDFINLFLFLLRLFGGKKN